MQNWIKIRDIPQEIIDIDKLTIYNIKVFITEEDA